MDRSKTTIGLLFGGKSGEHEVSLLSAKSVFEALDKDKYDVKLIGIDKKGRWLLSNSSEYLLNPTNPDTVAINEDETAQVVAVNTADSHGLMEMQSGKTLGEVDVFFPVMHGTFGEDGSIQGLLELLDVAYVGSGVLGSAVGMDKDVMKRLLEEANIPVAPFYSFKKKDISSETLQKVADEFQFPIFVKPANLGSSVGVSKADNLESLEEAVAKAFEYDTKILLEKAVKGREIECSVLGNDSPKASLPGEVIPTKDFYSYEAKYLDENGAILQIPAKLDDEVVSQVQSMAIKTFKTLDCSGMARVDFFLTAENKLFVNEINTIPGFTKISMYPKLWEVSGISYPELLDKLIQLAFEKHTEKRKLKRSFK